MGMDGWLHVPLGSTVYYARTVVALATITHAGRTQRREGHPGYY
jgi:hypothetical protein